MTNNSIVDFSPKNFLSDNSDSESFREHHIGSSSHIPPPPPTTRFVIMKVPSGCDIIESIFDVARRNQTSLAIQSVFGTVASVTLRKTANVVPAIVAYGPFNILSLTGCYFYDNQYTLFSEATPPPSFFFGIHFSTSHGRVFGGNVGGRVIAYKEVILTILTFKNLEILKYVPEGEESEDEKNYNKNCNEDPINFNDNGDDLSTFNSSN
ncbi:hypothetical protein VNO80_30731 [Phaseolus coccineus]|uniref:PPC domain-containing protein n=1 Tax=Phaseolus coccineus TaxID=3886 RepID=A0AAN9QDR3_PHACN